MIDNNKNIVTCKRCVMDSTDQDIVFDENGICDHCNTFDSHIDHKWKSNIENNKFEKISDKIKKNSKSDYDCLIGVSGGIDSSYLLHIVVEKFKLNPLVYHVDSGWNSKISVSNIKNLVEKLNLDLVTDVIDWEEMKDIQLSFIKSGVPHIDAPQDHCYFASLYRFASKNNFKFILTGANYATESIRNPIKWMYYQSDIVQLKDIHKKFGKNKIINFPTTNIFWHKIYLPYFRNIKTYRPLDYINYNKKDSEIILKNKYNFITYKNKHNESRFTKFYESYWLYEKFCYDVRKVQLSSLILSGQIDRSSALKIISSKPYDKIKIKDDFEYVANKLDLTTNQLKFYFNSENKSFTDYKNLYFFYKIGHKFLNYIGVEKGGKR